MWIIHLKQQHKLNQIIVKAMRLHWWYPVLNYSIHLDPYEVKQVYFICFRFAQIPNKYTEILVEHKYPIKNKREVGQIITMINYQK